MADKIFTNCHVVTMVDDVMETEAVAVKDDVIMAVGLHDDVIVHQTPSTEVVDLGGHTLLPGLIEPHSHPIHTATSRMTQIDLGGFEEGTRRDDLWARLRNAVETTTKGAWIIGHSLNPILVPDFPIPTRDQLDSLTTDHPIYISLSHGHTITCNSSALTASGIDESTPDPPGGIYHKDAGGRLTGVIDEKAMDKLFVVVPQITREMGREAVRRQLAEYARVGVTTVGATGLFSTFPAGIRTLEEMCSTPSCPVRMVVYHRENAFNKKAPSRGTPGKDGFCVIGVKFWADGSPFAGTIAVQDPFLDTHMTRDLLKFPPYPYRGLLIHTADELHHKMAPIHEKGWQLATHAHGERAIDQVLDVYERLLREHPRSEHRHRIEHCCLITEKQLSRAKQLGVSLSFFVDHVYYFGQAIRDDIIGPERAERYMPLATASREGHQWTLHSDSPVVPLNPFRTMWTAATRVMRGTAEAFSPRQCVSVLEALKAYTTHAAAQIHHQEVLGSVQVGKLADFTVVNRNPLTIPVSEVKNIEVMATYRSGNKVKFIDNKL